MSALSYVTRGVARRLWHIRNSKRVQAEPDRGLPRLFVDISVISREDAGTGIQRVVRAVWSELQGHEGEAFELVPVYATRERGYCAAPADFLSRKFDRSWPNVPANAGSGDVFLGLDLGAHLLPLHREQLAWWRSCGAKIALVVYDLLPLKHPQWFTTTAVRHFGSWTDILREECDLALCISDSVAHDLRTFLENSARLRIGRLRLSGDMSGSRPTSGVSSELKRVIDKARSAPTILMVGTVEPRKAYDKALDAFEYLWRFRGREAPRLIIVGRPGWRTEALQKRLRDHPESGHRLHWLTGVSDEALSQLYDACSALFLASYAEGFGLPAMEATLHGRCALVRDLPVFRERHTSGMYFFAEDDPEALGQRILNVLGQPRPSGTMISSGSWHDGVIQLLEELGLTHSPGAVHDRAAGKGRNSMDPAQRRPVHNL